MRAGPLDGRISVSSTAGTPLCDAILDQLHQAPVGVKEIATIFSPFYIILFLSKG